MDKSQAAQTLFVIYIRDSNENGSKIALNSACSKGLIFPC